jgi:hypothetical protein
MFGRDIYYTLKPLLPWRVRVAVRRFFTRRKRRSCEHIWPIDESAARVPEGWPGWPEGNKFAFVLTHDVEGPDGLEKCRRFAELEMELGFRSCFNFIPEGSYVVPPDLRTWLTEHGFEVGVHDLHHDGKLFRSQQDFLRDGARINGYLKDWGAVGFRAGFMLRNLDWYHDLNIEYDLSTFDTDPFEPMPDGVGTIYPFWIPAPAARSADSRSKTEKEREVTSSSTFDLPSSVGKLNVPAAVARDGYVELPYTLPQDSTLFLVFQETSPAIWLRKLDWLAARGGMALVNVHPDYLRFAGEKPSPRTFSVSMYTDLLNHVRTQHGGTFWHALPRDVARHYRRSCFGAS